MKKVFLIGFAAILMSACTSTPKHVEANEAGEVAQAEETALNLSIDTTQSIIEWIGGKHLGKTHHGTIKLVGGTVSVENGNVTAGDFSADMNSIKNLDLPVDGDYNQAKLEEHLKSPDFFDVAQFPTSTFHITSVKVEADDKGNTHKISGNMTIKGVAKEITFPAKVDFNENGFNASASFVINRLDWGVTYDQEALKGFLDGIAKKGKDDFVKNELELTVKLVAKQ
ncbi:MAG: YceI family protein [Bacteroidetes bacterium]|nr:YceI family protein [Bacteroidota bacterium]